MTLADPASSIGTGTGLDRTTGNRVLPLRTRVGVFLPTFHSGPGAGRSIAKFAQRAEALGYDSLWATDHLLHDSLFYRVPWLEPLAALTYAAAVTERVRLGTSVLVMPVRQPVVLAKQIATLQALSGDRFILGAGTGWDSREFSAVGARRSDRGAQTDESLEIVRQLLAGQSVKTSGRFYSLDDVRVGPTPTATPVWVAGGRQLVHEKSPEKSAMARTVLHRIGRSDGWIARPTSPPDQIAADMQDIHAHLAEIGRDPATLTFAHENFCHLVPTSDPVRARAEQIERFTAVMGQERPFEYFEQVYLTGTVEEIRDKIRARLATGITHLMLHTLEPSVRQLELWADQLLPVLEEV
jgi:probable F420-dependent oxidoreductase